MLSIRTVLCPVDFSASTDHQVDLAVDLCRAFGARLVLQHNKVELAVGAGVGWMWEPGHTAGALTPEQKIEELRAVKDPSEIELLGTASYPYVLVLMAASALVPMWYFRKRGWLR